MFIKYAVKTLCRKLTVGITPLLMLTIHFRYQVLATAVDTKTKEESQNIKSGKRVTVSIKLV